MVATRWFDERRGLVLGTLSAANATGQLVFLPLLAVLVEQRGWRTACLLVAVVASIVAFYASARGLQDGEAVPVIAVTGTAANIAGIAGGIIVFGDPMAGSALGITLQALAFVLVVVASAMMPAPLRAAGVAARA